MTDYSPRTLVARLKRRGLALDPAVEAALLALPREWFLPGIDLRTVYTDESVPLRGGSTSALEIASTQPSVTARMLAQLRLEPGQNVLQLGAGSGYTAALIQHIVGDEGRVTAVEIDPATVRQAEDNLQRALMTRVLVVQSDAALGYAPRAQYDRILANAALWDVPGTWVQQLRDDSVLVAPLWVDALQYSIAFRLEADGTLLSTDLTPTVFVPLRGNAAGPRMSVRIGGSSLQLTCDSSRLDSAALHVLMSESADIDYLMSPKHAGELHEGYLAYLMLHLPPEYTFSLYSFEGDQLPYGMDRSGFAILRMGSAAFVSLAGDARAYIFGGADSFIAAYDVLHAWRAAGRPGEDRLRVHLQHQDSESVSPSAGYRIFRRPDHDLHVWMA